MGTKNNPGKFDCYYEAEPDEPMFVLLGRDPTAGVVVRFWVTLRRALSAMQAPPHTMALHTLPDPDSEKTSEAIGCAEAMDCFVIHQRGKGTLRTLARDFAASILPPDLIAEYRKLIASKDLEIAKLEKSLKEQKVRLDDMIESWAEAPNRPRSLSPAADDAVAELTRARNKFSRRHASPHESWAVLMEEVDELWDEVRKSDPSFAAMRKEAVQCAAMALRFIEDVCDPRMRMVEVPKP